MNSLIFKTLTVWLIKLKQQADHPHSENYGQKISSYYTLSPS